MSIKALAIAVAVGILSGCASTPTGQIKQNAHHLEHGWDYHNHDHWGDLEVNRLCAAGQAQSPINIAKVTEVADKTGLKEHYVAENFDVVNNGHTIAFNVDGKASSYITLDGKRFDLLQFHYHVPSEHTVMNSHYPLEIHFVHKAADNALAVIGVLVNGGDYNAHLNQIITNLPKYGETNSRLAHFNIASLMPGNPSVYNYEGSLTTPPCTEEVQWLLKTTPISADGVQLSTLSHLYNGNNRPVQPQGNREVLLIK